ncbi:bifunctional cyclohexadienyl dehydrogenase/3-phosphoshikimate 1-carboxyvinyltransferase [Candidatus Omnitrophus magneticus]|uniref:Bifunctional cyclohexadienyl dehydrogenase/3-phosphoshikimate 1-carboxyvinyltransferase n=1 Tax=Candidatus Omnitrophus magneticus TaxID=1609969 RepID=A0A0F0CJF2_9BACT|nr:bifunctional cyclohexadienyl dehydrogenase/3-phosphoshikimate 1-carboxyvinyltransferase [Candidatus Omnitrophus magneticus]
MLNRLVIIGPGLIGGSLGKAVIARSLAREVVGVFRQESSLNKALALNAVTKGYISNYEASIKGAEMVVIATPVHIIKDVLLNLSRVESKGFIVTDVGSTKKEIVDFAKTFSGKFKFVGGHPLAGSEKTGVEFSQPNLFEKAVCVLTKDKDTDESAVKTVKNLWESTGALVDVLSPSEHDSILAFTSHLPHIVAYSLVNSEDSKYSRYMASGFRDTSRIASSDSILWNSILMSNRANVLYAISIFKKNLDILEGAIANGDTELLIKKIKEAQEVRDEIYGAT